MGWFRRSASWSVRRQLVVAAAVVAGGAVAVGSGVVAIRATGAPATAALPAGAPAVTVGAAGTEEPYRPVSGEGDLLARDVLDTIAVLAERQSGYSRSLFPTWSRSGEPGCDVRRWVLLTESVTPVERRAGCTLVGGTWLSAYDGRTLTDPSAIEIDHVVALKEAWDSGAWAWTVERREAYANDQSDLRTLIDRKSTRLNSSH